MNNAWIFHRHISWSLQRKCMKCKRVKFIKDSWNTAAWIIHAVAKNRHQECISAVWVLMAVMLFTLLGFLWIFELDRGNIKIIILSKFDEDQGRGVACSVVTVKLLTTDDAQRTFNHHKSSSWHKVPGELKMVQDTLIYNKNLKHWFMYFST